jgi:hypothetical protein
MAKKTTTRKKPRPKPGSRKPTRPARASTRAPASRAAAIAGDLDEQVLDVLRDMSTCAPDEITPCLDLRIDLCFTDELKRALAAPLQIVARRFMADARITRDESGDLDKVEDAVALVAEKVGADFTKVCK